MPDEEIPISSKNRFIDATKLVNKLNETTSSNSSDENESKYLPNDLGKSLSKRLLKKLTSKPIRASKRAIPTKGSLHVVMGMRDAIDILQTGHSVIKDVPDSEDNKPNLELLPVDNSRIATYFNDNHNQDENNYHISSSNAWDWISRGNIVSEQQEHKITQSKPEKNSKIALNPTVQTWDISNASKGGYCLSSNNTSDYQSQVGDIILIRLENKINDEWRLGVIRWMQSLSEQGVKIGMETLHGSVEVMEVLDVHHASGRPTELGYILLVTENTASGISKTLITPPNAVNTGDHLVLQTGRKTQNIVFQHLLEQTISFARFSYSETPALPNGTQN